MRTLYKALGLSPNADQQQIKTAYRSLARRFHPDVNAGVGADRLALINDAYATLGNPESRAAYDRDLAQRWAEIRRRWTAFTAMTLATFLITGSIVSFVVRRHLEARAAVQAKVPPSAPTQSRMPGGSSEIGTDLKPHSVMAANWTTYRDTRFDFALRYPAGVFALDAARSNSNVRTFVSRDGHATLRIVSPQSTGGISLASFRSALIKDRYAGASFEQTPRGQRWFALTGTRGDEVFLERITYSCDGKSVHGWQMLYPASQRATYDELAKLVLRNYPHGNGPGAGCDDARPKPQARQRWG